MQNWDLQGILCPGFTMESVGNLMVPEKLIVMRHIGPYCVIRWKSPRLSAFALGHY